MANRHNEIYLISLVVKKNTNSNNHEMSQWPVKLAKIKEKDIIQRW